MAAREDNVRIVLDARPLAELLVARRGRPLFPALPPGYVKIVYSQRILEGVVAAFREMGVSRDRETEYLATLEREGVMREPGSTEQVYADAGRDEGIRLAVASGAQGYVTSDPGLVAFKKWEGVEITASVADLGVETEELDEIRTAARDDDVRIVLDARPLAGLLVARRGGPLFPPLPPGYVKIIYSHRILEGVVVALREMGISAPRERECIARLGREGIMMEPGAAEQVYADAARDEGLRLAVASGAQGYVSSDPDLVAFKKWEGVEIMASVAEIEVEAEEGDELVDVYYATTEQELDLVLKALAEAGIEAAEYTSRGFLGGGDLFPLPGGYSPQKIIGYVKVRAADAEGARDALASCGFPWGRAREEEEPEEKTKG